MYKSYLPETLPENWVISELDEIYGYLEFLGCDEEFLVSVMKHEYDNPAKPYFLSLSQTKGILERYEFEKLNWTEWFETLEGAVDSAIQLMEWINQNRKNFLPLTLEVLVSLGSADQLSQLEKYFEGNLDTHEYQGDRLVFHKVSLLQNAPSYAESAIQTICHYAKCYNIPIEEITGGLLTNEKYQLIADLRPELINRLNSTVYEKY
ncbi:hypothetical protein [Algoriphagus antarcticus]|uniref:Uncharacterized protein n=1 Tax=Algoriphagus antarcticus TaxID=238540 RepID=A0A3E0EAN1_9BACT|nr:hypothetical protein [Algoriphagus antarcticus]REG94309.1 hypothetical protein C8N25_101134 [Algoriphagus antarcticus]